ncbi:hypothetical protein HPB50_009941 [Hyalomma asiaticum]|uniref:Uncharacterized protein n=1 Tax=Hyalomma asiaticum TaxID=266040 RepID=A0ACB7TI27_HYAAI|nr:hypothetical protein HPB50_009941 [Hyalomma asiaticum]
MCAPATHKANPENLLNELQKAANEATKEVETDASIQAMDSHLASLLQKKHDIKEAWNKNKLNRHLRAEIAELGHEIESHAKKLCAQQWNNACDEADGKMRRGSKWRLLKHLVADSDKPTKGGAQLQIERLVLGLVLSAKAGHNTEALKRLEKSTNNFSRGIARIANKKAGLLEDNIIKAYHAFLVSHVAYAFPFLKLSKVEIKKIDVMLRKGLKTALGLPNSTSTEKLEQLGLHNTAEEIFEAQRTAQITRLSTTQAGHRILRDAGIRPIFQPEEKTKLTNDKRDRARALINNAKKHRTHALFVDAARYNGRQAFAVAVVDIDGTLINAATVQTRHAHEAEEMAIALALQNCRAHSKIYTDSKTAAQTFAAGLLARSTAKLTDNAMREYESKETLIEEEKAQIHISWFPAHMGQISGVDHCNPNEEVNRGAWRVNSHAAPRTTTPTRGSGGPEGPGYRYKPSAASAVLGGATRLT